MTVLISSLHRQKCSQSLTALSRNGVPTAPCVQHPVLKSLEKSGGWFNLRWVHLSCRILAHITSHFYSSVGFNLVPRLSCMSAWERGYVGLQHLCTQVPIMHESLCRGTWILPSGNSMCMNIFRVHPIYLEFHPFLGHKHAIEKKKIPLQPTLCSAATWTRQGCNPKALAKEVDHHLNLDESRLQLRLHFLG